MFTRRGGCGYSTQCNAAHRSPWTDPFYNAPRVGKTAPFSEAQRSVICLYGGMGWTPLASVPSAGQMILSVIRKVHCNTNGGGPREAPEAVWWSTRCKPCKPCYGMQGRATEPHIDRHGPASRKSPLGFCMHVCVGFQFQ